MHTQLHDEQTKLIALVLDTSMNACTAGIYDFRHNMLLSGISVVMERGHAEYLMPTIEQILEQSNLKYKDIAFVGVTNGPGAFTGMRIGITTAKILGLSLGIPVVSVSTFDALRHTYISSKQELNRETLMVLIETKRTDYYVQSYDKNGSILLPGACLTSAQLDDYGDIINTLFIGDSVKKYKDISVHADKIIFKEILYPEVETLAKLALDRYKMNAIGVTPYYIRPPDVTLSNIS